MSSVRSSPPPLGRVPCGRPHVRVSGVVGVDPGAITMPWKTHSSDRMMVFMVFLGVLNVCNIGNYFKYRLVFDDEIYDWWISHIFDFFFCFIASIKYKSIVVYSCLFKFFSNIESHYHSPTPSVCHEKCESVHNVQWVQWLMVKSFKSRNINSNDGQERGLEANWEACSQVCSN